MWVKILAGVAAALAVAGLGIYVALPAGHCCHGKSAETLKNSCCLAQTDICPDDTSSACPAEAGGCCSLRAAPSTDALAACTGGMAVSPAPQSSSKLKFACCGE